MTSSCGSFSLTLSSSVPFFNSPPPPCFFLLHIRFCVRSILPALRSHYRICCFYKNDSFDQTCLEMSPIWLVVEVREVCSLWIKRLLSPATWFCDFSVRFLLHMFIFLSIRLPLFFFLLLSLYQQQWYITSRCLSFIDFKPGEKLRAPAAPHCAEDEPVTPREQILRINTHMETNTHPQKRRATTPSVTRNQ